MSTKSWMLAGVLSVFGLFLACSCNGNQSISFSGLDGDWVLDGDAFETQPDGDGADGDKDKEVKENNDGDIAIPDGDRFEDEKESESFEEDFPGFESDIVEAIEEDGSDSDLEIVETIEEEFPVSDGDFLDTPDVELSEAVNETEELAKELEAEIQEIAEQYKDYSAYRMQDTNCDGIPDARCHTWSYSDDGKMVYFMNDDNCDGIPERCWAQSVARDEQGKLISRSSFYDDNCDGLYESCETLYDATKELVQVYRETSENCNSEPKNCVRFVSYKNSKSLMEGSSIYEEYDDNCDGVFDRECWEVGYDEYGLISFFRYDNDCNGIPEAVLYIFNSPYGMILNQYYDEGNDGTPDKDCRFGTVDEQGVYTGFGDDNCDGIADHDCVSGVLNADARVYFLKHDRRCNGKEIGYERYYYDEAGKLIDTTWENDKFENCVIINQNSSDGSEMRISDGNCDGIPSPYLCTKPSDECGRIVCTYYKYFYNEETRFYERKGYTDLDCDGIPDRSCETTIYNEYGNMVFKSQDEDCNGVTEQCETSENIYDDVFYVGVAYKIGEDCIQGPFSYCYTTNWEGNQYLGEVDAQCDGTRNSCVIGRYPFGP